LTYMTFKIASRLYNKKIAYISSLILMVNAVFFIGSTEILLDGFAILLSLIAIYLTIREKLPILAGILLGLAFFTTQKVGFIALLIVIYLLLKKDYISSIKTTLGGGIVALLGILLIYTTGLTTDFFHMTVKVLFAWETSVPIISMIRGALIEYFLFIPLIILAIPSFLKLKNKLIVTLLLLVTILPYGHRAVDNNNIHTPATTDAPNICELRFMKDAGFRTSSSITT